MPHLIANGCRLHVQCRGDGPAVVALHGLLVGNLATWFFGLVPALERRHTAIAYDLRGHGLSERPPTGYDSATMTADLEGLLAQLSATRQGSIDLVGHSFGALIALGFAQRHPERVRRLALVELPLPPARAGLMVAARAGDPTDLVSKLPPALADDVRRGGRRSRRLLAQLEALSHDTTLLSDLDAEPDLDDARLATLPCETLCLYGQRSSCLPAGDRLASVLPRARLCTLDGGHYLPLERPVAVTRALCEFLDA